MKPKVFQDSDKTPLLQNIDITLELLNQTNTFRSMQLNETINWIVLYFFMFYHCLVIDLTKNFIIRSEESGFQLWGVHRFYIDQML